MKRVGTLATAKIYVDADHAGFFAIVDDHRHRAKIIIADRKRKENRAYALIARPHVTDGIFKPRALYSSPQCLKTEASFIDHELHIARTIASWCVAAIYICKILTFQRSQRYRRCSSWQ